MRRCKFARMLCLVLVAVGVGLCNVKALYGQKPQRTVQDSSQTQATAQPIGPYYALVIGNNDYRYPHVPNLATAVNGAKAGAQLLGDRHGLTTQTLLNATRDQMFTDLV